MATITPSKPTADPVKHVFDNSHRSVFSAKAGQVLPVLALETIANSDYEIDVQDLLRTVQLNQAAFIRAKQNVDFFFVPYSQLFTRFNQFLNQKHDPVIAGSKLAKYLPNFNLLELVLSVATTPESYDPHFCDMFDFPYRYQVGKLLDMLGYGKVPLEYKLTKVTTGDVTTINDVWYLYLIDYFGVTQQEFDSWVFDSDNHLLDNWVTILINVSKEPKYRYQVNPFRAAAYCKIWNDFYRNPYRDEPLDPLYFNFDDIDCTTIASSDISSVREWTQFTDLFNMRYRRWKNDIFTASFPDAQFGAASFVSMNSNLNEVDYIALQDPKITLRDGSTFYDSSPFQGSLDGNGIALQTRVNGPGVIPGDVTSIWSNNISFGEGKIDMSFTIAALRQAVAMQHFGENAIRAGNRTPDNQRAHFGDAPVFDTDMHVKYLGTFDGTIDLNVVSSTGQSETQQGQSKFVGSLAANGISSLNGNKITFHAHDFGIIMACFSVLPEAEYNSIMCDKQNRKIEPFDFPFCELDDLGFQPIVKGDLGFPGQASNVPVGYAFPFAEYKTALDKVHGEFITFAVPIGGSGSPFPSLVKGSKVSFVSPRTELQYEQLRDVRNLYVNPRLFDNVFGVAADAKESTDQFDVNMFFDVKSRLPLSVLGLPQYI